MTQFPFAYRPVTVYSTELPFSIRKLLIRFAELYRNRRGRWIAAPGDQSVARAAMFKPTGFCPLSEYQGVDHTEMGDGGEAAGRRVA